MMGGDGAVSSVGGLFPCARCACGVGVQQSEVTVGGEVCRVAVV